MSALLYYYLATSCKTNLQSCMLHKCLWCLHFPPRFWRGKVCSQYEVSSCHTVLRTHTGKSPSCLFLNVSMTVIDMCTHVCIRQPPCKDDGRFCIYVSEFSRRKRWRLILWSSYATKSGHVYIFTWTVCRGWAITKYRGRIDAIKSETE